MSKKAQKIVFLGVVVKKNGLFFVKLSFLRKIGKHYLGSDGKKTRMVLFLWPFQVTKHFKNRGFSRHRGKPKMALLVAKVPFWEGAPKGVLLSVIPKSCALLKTLFPIVLSAKHSFADMRECNLKKTKNLPKKGGGLPECKKVFFGSFFEIWWFSFFVSLCFCAFALYTIAQNGYFPAFLEVFRLFCSHKRPVFNCFFSFYFVFFFLRFYLPFQKSIFSLLFVHQPLFRKDSLWGFFCFSLLAFFLS